MIVVVTNGAGARRSRRLRVRLGGFARRVLVADVAAEDLETDALLDLHRHLDVLDAGDLADDPALGDDDVPRFELVQHLLLLLGLLLLGTDHQQEENAEDQQDRQEAAELTERAGGRTRGCSGLRETVKYGCHRRASKGWNAYQTG